MVDWESWTKFEFSMLQVIEVSYNGFTGNLSPEYFKFGLQWKFWTQHSWPICRLPQVFRSNGNLVHVTYSQWQWWWKAWKESLRMSLITAIEISSNKFSGEIQESIGNLKRLHLLNLFGNSFTGQIPSSLKNLEHLESLDLSHNKLPGEIPQQLTRIDTLGSSMFPTITSQRGRQFNTFQNSSHEGNTFQTLSHHHHHF